MEYALEVANEILNAQLCKVLILVLMEYALEVGTNPINLKRAGRVLILVLMEYALEEEIEQEWGYFSAVLILVLMEYALEAR